MPNLRSRPRGPPPGPIAPGPGSPTRPSARILPEPPAFQAHPLAPAGACVNCGGALARGYAVPRCWECGRALCADCYWRHGFSLPDHRCAACASRPGAAAPSLSVSGGRAAAPARAP